MHRARPVELLGNRKSPSDLQKLTQQLREVDRHLREEFFQQQIVLVAPSVLQEVFCGESS